MLFPFLFFVSRKFLSIFHSPESRTSINGLEKPEWEDESDSLGGGEQLAAVGGQAIDGTVVALDFAKGRQRVRMPESQQASAAPANQQRGAWNDA